MDIYNKLNNKFFILMFSCHANDKKINNSMKKSLNNSKVSKLSNVESSISNSIDNLKKNGWKFLAQIKN